jgi:transforming growth factor-beta-induced protein
LTTVLTYHVTPNALFGEAVLAEEQLFPLQGEPIEVDAENLKVNDSNLIAIDIAASNGVIHVVDAVLVPPSIADPLPTIAEIAAGDENFSILVEAAVETGLVGVLSTTGPNLTVFAPTNDAFIELLDALGITKNQLFDNKPLLTTVLLYHLVNEELFAESVLASSEIYPMESEPIIVDGEAGQLNGVNIIGTDIDASNGVIHVIDGVLVPPAALQLLGD